MKIMKNMIIRTVVNAVWVSLAWTVLVFNPTVSNKVGLICVMIYAASMLFFRPMKPFVTFFKAEKNNNDSQVLFHNKRTALVLLSVKIIILICIFFVVLTGIILSNKLLLLNLGGKGKIIPIHKAIANITLLLNSLQLGINIAVLPLPTKLAMKERIILFSAIVIAIVGAISLASYILFPLYRKFMISVIILGSIAAGYILYKRLSNNS